jgi:hypothetical protein
LVASAQLTCSFSFHSSSDQDKEKGFPIKYDKPIIKNAQSKMLPFICSSLASLF